MNLQSPLVIKHDGAMRIALVSDSHLAPHAKATRDNWDAAAAYVARSDIDLTIHLGDITLDGETDETHLAAAHALMAEWPTTIRCIPGNHDVGDRPDRARLDRYRAVFGSEHWAIDAGAWRLVALDAQLLAMATLEADRQWDWLVATLAATDDRPVALFTHKPLFHEDPADPRPSGRYVPHAARTRLLDLLSPVNLRLNVSGHVHQHLDRTIDGVRHAWMPSTAFVIPDLYQARLGEKTVGLGVLTLSGADHRLDVVWPEGLRRHDVFDLGLYPRPKMPLS